MAISRRIALPSNPQGFPRLVYLVLAHTGAHLGDSWLWALFGLSLWRKAQREEIPQRKRRVRIVSAWMASMGGMFLLTLLIKQAVRRPRPNSGSLLYGPGPDVHSFPSGHAGRIGVILAWISALLPDWGYHYWLVALWVGWSRVALGIHYVGDVVVGFSLGLGLGKLLRRVLVDRPT